jgi:hypothetical protein
VDVADGATLEAGVQGAPVTSSLSGSGDLRLGGTFRVHGDFVMTGGVLEALGCEIDEERAKVASARLLAVPRSAVTPSEGARQDGGATVAGARPEDDAGEPARSCPA